MALTGTLKDFGIAEILQLIGQQAKSGVLHLRQRDEEVQVAVANGRIVSAEHARRRSRDRLGAMVVRAGLVTQDDLERALAEQARSLRRLGDVLVDMSLVSRDDVRQMTTLQTTETLYRLFAWKRGTYRFEPGPVEWDPAAITPLGAESVLMEGFRQLDEWPMVQRRIVSAESTFVRARPLEGAGKADAAPPEEGEIGEPERRVYALAEPGRSVERIVDLSRLGEFATWKALFTLVNLGVLEVIARPRRVAGKVGAQARGWGQRLRRGAVGLAVTFALASVVAVVAWNAAGRALGAPPLPSPEAAARRLAAAGQVSRLAGALEVWQLEHGQYPDRLQALIEARLVAPADLRYPYAEEYYYRRKAGGGFVLLPPLP